MELVGDRFGVAESVDDSYKTALDQMRANPDLKGFLDLRQRRGRSAPRAPSRSSGKAKTSPWSGRSRRARARSTSSRRHPRRLHVEPDAGRRGHRPHRQDAGQGQAADHGRHGHPGPRQGRSIRRRARSAPRSSSRSTRIRSTAWAKMGSDARPQASGRSRGRRFSAADARIDRRWRARPPVPPLLRRASKRFGGVVALDTSTGGRCPARSTAWSARTARASHLIKSWPASIRPSRAAGSDRRHARRAHAAAGKSARHPGHLSGPVAVPQPVGAENIAIDVTRRALRAGAAAAMREIARRRWAPRLTPAARRAGQRTSSPSARSSRSAGARRRGALLFMDEPTASLTRPRSTCCSAIVAASRSWASPWSSSATGWRRWSRSPSG